LLHLLLQLRGKCHALLLELLQHLLLLLGRELLQHLADERLANLGWKAKASERVDSQT